MPARSLPNSRRGHAIKQIVDAQTTIFRAFQEQPLPEWLKLDITLGQLRALFILFQTGPIPIGQVGARLGVGRPAASLLVDALVRQGLVERFEDPADRRRSLARLSPEAQRLITQQYLGGQQQYEGWLNQLGDDDLVHLAHALRELAGIAAPEQAAASG
jgi:DNA-binding MarR family transcriptional regulator